LVVFSHIQINYDLLKLVTLAGHQEFRVCSCGQPYFSVVVDYSYKFT